MRERVAIVEQALAAAGIPVLANDSHIVPVVVRDPVLCKAISDELLDYRGLYVQPINYPTVAKGTERLRVTVGPLHDQLRIRQFVAALSRVWNELGLARAARNVQSGLVPPLPDEGSPPRDAGNPD